MKKLKKCEICGKDHRNKKFCSRECQYISYKKLKVERIKIICPNCGKEFETTQNEIDRGKGKYCSRKCVDLHKKITYLGENNPMYGKSLTTEQKEKKSKIIKKTWEVEEIRNKRIEGLEKYRIKNGFFPGTDKESLEKRKMTILKKYGKEHNWSVQEVRDKCEKTCLERYGKNSWVIAQKSSKNSKIEEEIFKFFDNLNIEYEKSYYVYFENEKNEKKYKIYDCYIPKYNLLIEADGDYWHGNPDYYSELNDTQLKNKQNDLFKNKLAKKFGYSLVRIWEHEINNLNFEKIINFINGEKN